MKQDKRISIQRRRRKFRVSNRVKRDSIRPRLSVFRSHRHFYVQVIDDEAGRTLAAASTAEKPLSEDLPYGGNKDAAAAVGRLIAERAIQAGIKQVALDRRQYKYHGRVAALAAAAREAGLEL